MFVCFISYVSFLCFFFTIVSENATGRTSSEHRPLLLLVRNLRIRSVVPEGPSSERLNETLMFFQAFHSSIETRLDFSMLHIAEKFFFCLVSKPVCVL